MCPPRMSDGRHFTDYKPRCGVDASTLNGQTMNSYELRQYMITNAENLMQKNRDAAVGANKCGPCVEPWNQGTMLPEQSVVKCTTSTCTRATNDPYGLGQGRDYGSAPNASFISKMTEENAAFKPQCNDCLLSSDRLKSQAPVFEESSIVGYRQTIPGGGEPMNAVW